MRGMGTTCLRVSPTILIDAGNIMEALGEESLKIDHIILTHAHLDHIIDLPFLVEYAYGKRTRPINIYAQKETLKALKDHLLNWEIWPEFGSIKLSNSSQYTLNYVEVEPYKEFEIEDLKFYPIPSNHTVPTLGYAVLKNGRGFLFTSDTYKNPHLWEFLNNRREIKALITEVSFPSDMSDLARKSKHHTPLTLKEDLKNLKRKDLEIYIIHIKPSFLNRVLEDLKRELPQVKVLKDGARLTL